MFNYINEAFRQLDLLTESVFDTSDKGLTDLSTFVNNDDEVEQITVINDELEDETEIPDPKVGDLILNCNICHSLLFKNKDEIAVENGEVNKDYPCPRCGETDGYTIVGEIQVFNPQTTEEEIIEEPATEEPVNESLNEASSKTPWDIIAAAYPELNNMTEDFDNEAGVKAWSANAIKAYKQAAQNLGLTDFNMTIKGYGNSAVATISFKKNGKVMSKEVDLNVTHVNSVQDAIDFLQYTFNDELMEALKESFNNVSIETEDQRMTMTSEDNGKVTVTTEPIEEVAVATEDVVITPVSDETKDEILTANAEVEDNSEEEDDMLDFDFDEVDETSFDELGESYLKNVYENVDSFKTTNISATDNQLIVEGVISFKSGTTKNTGFIFEAKDATRNGKLRFIGENKHFSRGNKSFTLVGSMNESKKFICESFTYNYRAKTPEGKPTRVYGTVSCKNK